MRKLNENLCRKKQRKRKNLTCLKSFQWQVVITQALKLARLLKGNCKLRGLKAFTRCLRPQKISKRMVSQIYLLITWMTSCKTNSKATLSKRSKFATNWSKKWDSKNLSAMLSTSWPRLKNSVAIFRGRWPRTSKNRLMSTIKTSWKERTILDLNLTAVVTIEAGLCCHQSKREKAWCSRMLSARTHNDRVSMLIT